LYEKPEALGGNRDPKDELPDLGWTILDMSIVSRASGQQRAGGSGDTKASERYQYESLEHAWDGIRLLELHAGDFDDDIRCSIHMTRLSEDPEYEAISYVWGDASITESVDCEGRHLDITVNLAGALRQLRLEGSSRILYADAICINQQNLDERGRQVRIMAEIFHAAESVIIWLGPDIDQSACMAFDYMRNYACYLRQELNTHIATGSEQWANLIPFENYGKSLKGSAAVAAICGILNHPWFSRVWVLQEAAVARSASLRCGHEALLIEDLVFFAHGVDAASDRRSKLFLQGRSIDDTFQTIWAVYQTPDTWLDRVPFRPHAMSRYQSNITNLLRITVWRTVTDPRDYVYALLRHPAMQTGSNEILVQPDYNITFDDLCHQITSACLLKKHDFSILSVVQRLGTCSSAECPTWVPTLSLPNGILDHGVFSAGTDLTPVHVEVDGARFVCSGLNLCLISSSFGKFPTRSDLMNGDCVPRLLQSLRLLLQQLSAHPGQLGMYGGLTELEFLALLGDCAGIHDFATADAARNKLQSASAELHELLLMDTHAMSERSHHDDAMDKEEVLQTSIPEVSFRESDMGRLLLRLGRFCSRRVFRLESGAFGLGPGTLYNGDICCIINGANVPYVLHPRDDASGTYEFVGECNVPGIMFGEIKEWLERGEVHEQTFTIH
jgi:hypothetical protein